MFGRGLVVLMMNDVFIIFFDDYVRIEPFVFGKYAKKWHTYSVCAHATCCSGRHSGRAQARVPLNLCISWVLSTCLPRMQRIYRTAN